MNETLRHLEPGAARPFRILLAEDDTELRELISWALGQRGYQVVQCRDGDALMKHLGPPGPGVIAEEVDLVISDIRMPGSTGLQVLARVGDLEEPPPVIMVTAFPDQETRDQAERLHAEALFAKPFELEDLLNKVEALALMSFASGRRRRRPASKGHSSVQFPIEIAFDGNFESGPLEASIKEAARQLNRYREAVSSCRVRVYQNGLRQPGKHDWQVHLEISVPGARLAINHDPSPANRHGNPDVAIRAAFATARRRLAKRLHHKGAEPLS